MKFLNDLINKGVRTYGTVWTVSLQRKKTLNCDHGKAIKLAFNFKKSQLTTL